MAFGDSDLAVFTADMGVAVTFGGVTVRGVLDENDTPMMTADATVEGIVHGTTLTLTKPALAQLTGAGLATDSALTIDGRSFVVREFMRIDDGKISQLIVAEVE